MNKGLPEEVDCAVWLQSAERGGFEPPTSSIPTKRSLRKSAAINHSATSPEIKPAVYRDTGIGFPRIHFAGNSEVELACTKTLPESVAELNMHRGENKKV